MAVANTLAFYDKSTIMAVKKFYLFPGVDLIELFPIKFTHSRFEHAHRLHMELQIFGSTQ